MIEKLDIHLYRGDSWNRCELLEKFTSKNKRDILNKLTTMITSVDNGDYNVLIGYKIDEGDLTNENLISDHEIYSAKK